MNSLKTAKVFFCLAVLLFVAKPFIGFSIISFANIPVASNSLLIKSFSNRKPEDLKDAEAKKATIHRLLSNPPAILLLTIAALLGLLFTALFKKISISTRFLNELQAGLIPIQPNLLTGKLSI